MKEMISNSKIKYIDLFAFIHTPDPTKVEVVKRDQVEDEPLLLQTIVGRTVPLLLVTPDRAGSELEISIDKLFDEGGSVADVGGSSHPPKRFKEDHGTPSGPSVAGKSRSSVQRLLVGAVLNVEVRGEPIPTLPFKTSSVSATSDREGEDHTDSVTGRNLRTISAPPSILVMTAATTTTFMADPAVVVKEKTAKPYLFVADSSFAGRADPNAGVFSDLTGSDFLVSGVRTVIDPDTDLQKVYMSLSVEVRMRAEYNIKEKRRLKSVVDEKNELLKVRENEERNASLKKERDAMDAKVTGLEASVMGKDRELTDLNAQLTFAKSHNDSLLIRCIGWSRRWLLTHGMELTITKCLHSLEYLSALGAAIGKAIEKGMQDGLSARITHGAKALRDVSVPFSEPFSAEVLTGTEGTSDTVLATAITTTALSTTLASASTVPPIFVDDYEITGTDDQTGADGNADPFPNVDDAELNIP
nr:hypothetical protein [Tanacetum cinerariifolium]